MAQVTSLTAAKSLELADENVVSGHLSGDDLILVQRDGTEQNLGSVRGDAGPTGATGGVSAGDLSDAVLASSDRAGRGIIARDSFDTDDPLGSTIDTWYNLAGISITFTPVLNRIYEIHYFSGLTSLSALTQWDLELLGDGSPLQRANVFQADNGRQVGCGNTFVFKADAGDTHSTIYTLRARMSTSGAGSTTGATSPSTLTIVDIGSI